MKKLSVLLLLLLAINFSAFKSKEILIANKAQDFKFSVPYLKEKFELLEVIKDFECYKAYPYVLFGDTLIGYGHLNTEGFNYLSKEEAERLLWTDFHRELSYFPKQIPYKQRLLLAALSYNIGVSKVKKSNLYLAAKNGIKEKEFTNLYLKFSNIDGEFHKQLNNRRKEELKAVFK